MAFMSVLLEPLSPMADTWCGVEAKCGAGVVGGCGEEREGVNVVGNSTAPTEFVAPIARVGARFFPLMPYFGEEGE
jgi:hypothetical protein